MRPRAFLFGLTLVVGCASFQDAPSSASDDAGSTLDAGGDAGPPRGCAGHADDLAHFCDDFEEGDIGFRWTGKILDPGTTITASPTAYSGTNALRVGFTGAPPADASVFLRRERDPSLSLVDKSRIKLTYVFKVVDAPFPQATPDYVTTTVIQFDPTTCTGKFLRQVELTFGENADLRLTLKGFQDGCDGSNNASYEQITMPHGMAYFKDDFRTISLEIKRGACAGTTGAASIVGEIDGIPTPCKTLVVDPFANANDFGLRIGAYVGSTGTTTTTFLYDDVAFDID
jgi:hypothetical protein